MKILATGGRGGFRGGRGGGRGGYDQGPPERVVPLGTFSHACQEDLVVKSSIQDVPYFNAPIYLENITQVCFKILPENIIIFLIKVLISMSVKLMQMFH